MGGHGALSIYLKSKPGTYQSASGFAPIWFAFTPFFPFLESTKCPQLTSHLFPFSNPTQCPWGDKAFGGYLADPAKEGPAYDSTHLLDNTALEKDSIKILVDYGTGDDFYKKGKALLLDALGLDLWLM
jgi:S-formylglutathione hydrolase